MEIKYASGGWIFREPACLDVEHGSAGAARKGFERDLIERLLEAGGNLVPGIADRHSGFAFAADRALEQGGIHRIHDLAQRDRFRRSAEKVSAGLAPAAVDEPGAAEIVEDLH